MDDQIFEILGIVTREDSYTDLIAYAFKKSSDFRQKLLSNLNETDNGNWDFYVRPPIPIKFNKSRNSRKKDVPDMILLNKKENKIIVIENKIFSGEGWNQTQRYASDEFKTSAKEHFSIINPDFAYYYLTLGKKPTSPNFELLPYSNLAKCIDVNQKNTKLNLLLTELKSRINEYDNWPLPKNDEVIITYLRNGRGFVNFDRTFENVVTNLVNNNDLKLDVGVTSNKGCGYIPLARWRKENWQSKKYPALTDGAECYDIHFELQWNTCNDAFCMRLDYHTNPYMTKKEMKNTQPGFNNNFREKKMAFFEFVKTKNPSLWHIKNKSLSVADFSFDDVHFGEFKQKTNKLIGNMVGIIDEYLDNI